MSRVTRSRTSRQLASRIKKVTSDDKPIKEEPRTPRKRQHDTAILTPDSTRRKKPKADTSSASPDLASIPSIKKISPKAPASAKGDKNRPSPSAALQARKLAAYTQYAKSSPFPTFPHPTPAEAKLAHRILAAQHGARVRPPTVVAPTSRAGCGNAPSVLDALVRTVLSQNTSDGNAARAKRGMDAAYGRSDDWDAIAAGGPEQLEEAIRSGGLAKVKSRVILTILEEVHARRGAYSLEHLRDVADGEEVMRELLSFKGIGPKTASCVMLFCLGRESFAVDTHVYRIAGLLGWRPEKATREETYAHLDVKIPDEDKYGLHILMVSHGKKCEECKAGGKNLGRCELRKAFRKGKLKGEAGEDVKDEEMVKIEQEEE